MGLDRVFQLIKRQKKCQRGDHRRRATQRRVREVVAQPDDCVPASVSSFYQPVSIENRSIIGLDQDL